MYRRWIALLVVAAFALRVGVRFATGGDAYLLGGYQVYVQIAATFLNGHGLCELPGRGCAVREPVYPLLVAMFLAAGRLYPGLAIIQAAIGATLPWIAWKIGRELLNARAAVVAACLAAFNPYTVVHDTALQETVVVNALIALAVWRALRLRRSGAPVTALGVGVALGLSVLTTARVAAFVPLLVAWTAFAAGPTAWARRRAVAVLCLPVLVLVGGWLARNWRQVGAPVLTTEAGENLWGANNDWTFSHFPAESIDRSVEESYAHLTGDEIRALDRAGQDAVTRNRLLEEWGVEYVTSHPRRTAWRALQKIWIAMSGRLSPARNRLADVGYTLVFVPIHGLAAIGLWRTRRAWRAHLPVYLLFLSFLLTTGLFWAHTSHKSCLDVFLCSYAAFVLVRHGVGGRSAKPPPAS